jgi:hypothetical protein
MTVRLLTFHNYELNLNTGGFAATVRRCRSSTSRHWHWCCWRHARANWLAVMN